MTRKEDCSDDRLAVTQEIAEGLKKRGCWVPQAWWSSDILTAIFMALDKKAALIEQMKGALQNAQGFFCQADTKLSLGKRWSSGHGDAERSIRDALEASEK